MGKWLVFVVSAASGAAVWWAWPRLPIITDAAEMRSAVSAVLGVDATMLGFLVSTGALIYAVAQTSLVQNLYRTGHMPRLLAALFFDAALFFGALAVALVCTLVPVNQDALRLLVSVNVAAMVGLIPLAHTMWHLLNAVGPKRGALDLP